jgi:hypothetical protein
MKASYLLTVCALLSACAMQRTTYLPDGRKGSSIDCSGAALNWGYCERKAGQTCGAAGYDVVSKEGEGGSVVAGTSSGVFGGTTSQRTMLVACKVPPAAK